MPPKGNNLELDKFDGGLNVQDPEYKLDWNESPDLDNIIPDDRGFKKRTGDAEFNSTAMVSGSTPIVGLVYVKYDSGNEFINAVAGTKFFSGTTTGTMTDRTGAVTITAGAANYWTPVSFNDLQIWFGGAPDVPFQWTGSGNATVLTGTPPSAYTVFGANNRIFAVGTAANPSRIYWCILNNPNDWTGTGSGNADVARSDGERLQCGIVVGPDSALLFKNSSTHFMVLTRSPFPIYQLQKGIGICGPRAWAYANGTIYFMTPSKRILATTNGTTFEIFPPKIDPILNTINSEYIGNVQGIYYQPYNWIIFLIPTGTSTTLNYAIIWDLRYKCFVRCTTGFKANVLAMVQNYRLFGGHYNGKVYEKFKSDDYADASETSPGAIDGYWRTPFKSLGDGLDTTIHPLYFSVLNSVESSTSLELSYGFDFAMPQATETFSLVPTGGAWDSATWDSSSWGGNTSVISRMLVKGRGNLFSLKVRNNSALQGYETQGISIRMRTDKSRKLLQVT